MKAAAVIPAAGSGSRMEPGGGRKQYLELGREPMLLRALRPIMAHPEVAWVIVALPPEDANDPPFPMPDGVIVVEGGAERGESVRRALEAVPREADVVLIHDGARPLLTADVVERTLRAAAGGSGAVAAVPVADTLKRVAADGTITTTVDRRGLWRAQTPQAFPRAMIVDAYRRAAEEGATATDDAGLVERYGGRVVVVEGDVRNLKVTRAADLTLAELLLTADTAEGGV